jgi:uncharacterized protein (TIGR00290 family)
MSHNGNPYFVSWSGGKDACLAAWIASGRGQCRPTALLTMLAEDGSHTRGHNLPVPVVQAQADVIGASSLVYPTTWEGYETTFLGALAQLTATGVTEGVFGDIDLDPHREWVERVCGSAGVAAREPLWQKPRRKLLAEFLGAGFEAIVVAVRDGCGLGADVLGRTLDEQLIAQFEAAGIDACGEEGEYHTLVIDGPLFERRIEIVTGASYAFDGHQLLELALA